MRILRTTAFLLCAVAISMDAQSARRIGDDQPLQNLVSALPIEQRDAMRHALMPEVTRWLNRMDGSDQIELHESALSVELDLRYERHRGLTFVQAYNLDGCGAVGNCEFFILDGQNHVLLGQTVGYYLTILGSRCRGFPDILLGEHISASQTYQRWYRFQAGQYRTVRCAIDTYGQAYDDKKRHREFGPCADLRAKRPAA